MTKLQIIGLPQSNWVWATRIACAEKGVAHENIGVMPHSPEVTALNPLGKIPVMRHGDFTIAEARAICRYVDQAFDGPALMPKAAREGALAEQWASMIQTSVEPVAIRQYLFGYMFPKTPDQSPDRAAIDAALPTMTQHLGVLAQGVSDGQLGRDDLTIADAFLIPVLFYLKNTPEGGALISGSKPLSGYIDRQMARASVTATLPPPLPQ